MKSSVTIHEEPHDRRRRLAQLGLKEEWLIKAVRVGQAAKASCTVNDPPSFGGTSLWALAVRTIREQTLPHGFDRSDEGNLPFTINASRNLAIAVATGDSDTGDPKGSPCTKHPHGPRTRDAVDANQYCLNFGQTPVTPEALDAINLRETWILLINSNLEKRKVSSELSRPVNMDEGGRVDGWAERIILDDIPLDADEVRLPGEGDNGPQSPEIVLDVKRRG
jgi:hypothetical protein